MKARMTEDAFLEARTGQPVAIYLINGIKLLGSLIGHDAEVVFLNPRDAHDDDATAMMVSKAAISTVVATP
jgi:sRNA-binding regulator protein Hfq